MRAQGKSLSQQLLARVGAFFDPAEVHLDDDVDKQPMCSGCPNPATDQVHIGWAMQPGSSVVQALFAWLCDECAEARREAEIRPSRFPFRFPRSDRPVDEL